MQKKLCPVTAFTLIEVLAAFALLGMLFVSFGKLLVFANNYVVDLRKKTQLQLQLADWEHYLTTKPFEICYNYALSEKTWPFYENTLLNEEGQSDLVGEVKLSIIKEVFLTPLMITQDQEALPGLSLLLTLQTQQGDVLYHPWVSFRYCQ